MNTYIDKYLNDCPDSQRIRAIMKKFPNKLTHNDYIDMRRYIELYPGVAQLIHDHSVVTDTLFSTIPSITISKHLFKVNEELQELFIAADRALLAFDTIFGDAIDDVEQLAETTTIKTKSDTLSNQHNNNLYDNTFDAICIYLGFDGKTIASFNISKSSPRAACIITKEGNYELRDIQENIIWSKAITQEEIRLDKEKVKEQLLAAGEIKMFRKIKVYHSITDEIMSGKIIVSVQPGRGDAIFAVELKQMIPRL